MLIYLQFSTSCVAKHSFLLLEITKSVHISIKSCCTWEVIGNTLAVSSLSVEEARRWSCSWVLIKNILRIRSICEGRVLCMCIRFWEFNLSGTRELGLAGGSTTSVSMSCPHSLRRRRRWMKTCRMSGGRTNCRALRMWAKESDDDLFK